MFFKTQGLFNNFIVFRKSKFLPKNCRVVYTIGAIVAKYCSNTNRPFLTYSFPQTIITYASLMTKYKKGFFTLTNILIKKYYKYFNGKSFGIIFTQKKFWIIFTPQVITILNYHNWKRIKTILSLYNLNLFKGLKQIVFLRFFFIRQTSEIHL